MTEFVTHSLSYLILSIECLLLPIQQIDIPSKYKGNELISDFWSESTPKTEQESYP